MLQYVFIKELTGKPYHDLLRDLVINSSEVRFILRENEPETFIIKSFLSEIAEHAIGKIKVSGWPVTILHSGKWAWEYRFSSNPALIDVLYKYSLRQYGWQYPNLPEDIYFVNNADECFYSLWSSADLALLDDGYINIDLKKTLLELKVIKIYDNN